jgi:hypothetical protein
MPIREELGAMSRTDKREVEDLARALAHHNRRRWQTMPARAYSASDANSGREAWLRRAQIILEAVDTAMTLAIKRDKDGRGSRKER